jgi:hypothetical protein
MNTFDEKEIQSFLSAWEVCEPSETLTERTMYLMREQLANQAMAAPAPLHPGFLAVIGLALLLTVNLFYMLTLGSILRLTLPPMFTTFLSHSLVAFSAAEICLIAGAIMVFFFKYVQFSGARTGESHVVHGLR